MLVRGERMRIVDRERRLQHWFGELVVCMRLVRLVRLEHALSSRLRLEHAILRRLRLEPVRLGAVELRSVIARLARVELRRRRRGRVTARAFGFFRSRAAAKNIEKRAAPSFTRRWHRRLRLRGAWPGKERIGLLRIRHARWRCGPHPARRFLRQCRRTLQRGSSRRRRIDVALRLASVVRLARLGRARLNRTGFGGVLPLPRLAQCRRHLARSFYELTRRFSLHLADRLLEREALAGDVGLLERGRHPAQLREQRRARAIVDRAAVIAGVLFERADRAGDEGIIVGHRSTRYWVQGSPGFRPRTGFASEWCPRAQDWSTTARPDSPPIPRSGAHI